MAIALVYHGDPTSNCYRDLRIGAFDMSHAGQESHWFAMSDGRHLSEKPGIGIVDLTDTDPQMQGFMGLARNSSKPGAIPVFSHSKRLGDFALAFDGYIINGDRLRERYGGRTDGDLAARFIADADDFGRGVENFFGEKKGHACVAVATERGEGYAARCPLGIRPLVYGNGETGHALVSESRALSHIGMKRERDVAPGEIAAVDGSGIHTLKQLEGRRKVCSFLWAYYQMVDCVTEGIDVDLVRSRIAGILASMDRKAGLVLDAVCSIPDSGDAYAQHYAIAAGIPYLRALEKTQYAGRSYDRYEQWIRDLIAGVKLSVIRNRIRKRMAATEDSFRRGTQAIRSGGPIELLRGAGVEELHIRVGSPRNVAYCRCSPAEGGRYKDEELAANRFKTDGDLAKYLGVASVAFIGLDDFVPCITEGSSLTRDDLCLGCYTGEFGFLD